MTIIGPAATANKSVTWQPGQTLSTTIPLGTSSQTSWCEHEKELLSWKQIDAYDAFQGGRVRTVFFRQFRPTVARWLKHRLNPNQKLPDYLNPDWILVKDHSMTRECTWHGLFQKEMKKLYVHITHVWESKHLWQYNCVVCWCIYFCYCMCSRLGKCFCHACCRGSA